MAERLTVARPYAEAVFALASEQKTLPQWQRMLALAHAVNAEPRMAAYLDAPEIDATVKAKTFADICGDQLDVAGRRFIDVLVQAGRITLLPEIETLFLQYKDAAENTVEARIETALPLNAAQEAELQAMLTQRLGKKIHAQIEVNPALIGGTRITVGDTVIDASVQGRLAAMARELHAG